MIATRPSFQHLAKVAVLFLSLCIDLAGCTHSKQPDSIPPHIQEALAHASQVSLFAIDPNRLTAEGRKDETFHDHRILAHVEISSQEDRRRVVDQLQKDIAAWDGNYVMCFNPRHGLRAAIRAINYDFLICYECERVEIFEGDKLVVRVGINEHSEDFERLFTTVINQTTK